MCNFYSPHIIRFLSVTIFFIKIPEILIPILINIKMIVYYFTLIIIDIFDLFGTVYNRTRKMISGVILLKNWVLFYKFIYLFLKISIPLHRHRPIPNRSLNPSRRFINPFPPINLLPTTCIILQNLEHVVS